MTKDTQQSRLQKLKKSYQQLLEVEKAYQEVDKQMGYVLPQMSFDGAKETIITYIGYEYCEDQR